MNIEFKGKVWYWRGPSPFFFVTVPPNEAAELKAISSHVTYGWGMIPVKVRIGKTEFKTSLWPKDGSYIVPLKVVVRRAEKIDEGDEVKVKLVVG